MWFALNGLWDRENERDVSYIDCESSASSVVHKTTGLEKHFRL
jgi:hypothetical protein